MPGGGAAERTGMAIKLLMTYDIIPGQEQEYFEFVVREFVPGLQRIGLQPTEAWYTTYGERPQFLTGAVTNDIEAMKQALESETWGDLKAGLLEYATNFKSKVVSSRAGFQMI